jgi:glucokinase
MLGVFWGTGVGGGLILDGKPWKGRGAGGEIGHMVVKLGGALCTCGRRGCMEAYAGRAAMEIHVRERVEEGKKTDLFKLAKQHDRPRLTSGIWARALEHGDKLAEHTIERAVQALGAGIASAINLLDVEAVILGGGLGVRLGEPYAKRIAKAMQPHLFHDSNPPKVLVAALGDLGGAIGAALLVAKAPSAVKSSGAKSSGAKSSGAKSSGAKNSGAKPAAARPSAVKPAARKRTAAKPSAAKGVASKPAGAN